MIASYIIPMSSSAIRTGSEKQSNSSALKSASSAPELSLESRSSDTSQIVGDPNSIMDVITYAVYRSHIGVIAPSIKLTNTYCEPAGEKLIAINVLQIFEAVNPKISQLTGKVVTNSLFEGSSIS